MSYEYYSILGVDQMRRQMRSRKHIRKKLWELHPDQTGGDKKGEHFSKEVGAAYETPLSDPQKRTMIRLVHLLVNEAALDDLKEDLISKVWRIWWYIWAILQVAVPVNNHMVVKDEELNSFSILLIVTKIENLSSNMTIWSLRNLWWIWGKSWSSRWNVAIVMDQDKCVNVWDNIWCHGTKPRFVAYVMDQGDYLRIHAVRVMVKTHSKKTTQAVRIPTWEFLMDR